MTPFGQNVAFNISFAKFASDVAVTLSDNKKCAWEPPHILIFSWRQIINKQINQVLQK